MKQIIGKLFDTCLRVLVRLELHVITYLYIYLNIVIVLFGSTMLILLFGYTLHDVLLCDDGNVSNSSNDSSTLNSSNFVSDNVSQSNSVNNKPNTFKHWEVPMEKRCLDCLKEELGYQFDDFKEVRRDYKNYAKLFRKTQNRLGGSDATLRAEHLDLVTYLEGSQLIPRYGKFLCSLQEVRRIESLIKKQDPLFNSIIVVEDFERFGIMFNLSSFRSN